MLGSITVSTLLFMSYFVTYSVNPWPQNQGQYAPTGQCPNTAYSDVMASMPDCQPRETLVKLDLPNDEMIEEVLPSHVLVPRCSGVCYEGNNFHKCVPDEGGRSTQNFQVFTLLINTFCLVYFNTFKLAININNNFLFLLRLFLPEETIKDQANLLCNAPVLT